jgi:hypothetical protein
MRRLRCPSSPAGLNPIDGYVPSHAAKGGPSLRAAEKLFVIGRNRRSTPRQLVTAALGLAALITAGTVYVIHLHSDAQKSAFVQSRGVPATGTVLSVQNSGYQSRAWNHYSARIEVRLVAPVAGDEISTVYYPDNATVTSGQPVHVLVNPRAPQYAEVAGYPYYSNGEWIFWAVAVGSLPALAMLIAPVSVIATIRHRRGLPAHG